MSYSWAKMPNRWAMDGGLESFNYKVAGGGQSSLQINASIAALKTYLAICTRADFSTGIAKVTYDQLCVLLGVSRALVARSLRMLEAHELLKMTSPNTRAGSVIYVSRWQEDAGFAKIPKTWLYQGRQPLERVAGGERGELLGLRGFKFNKLISLHALKAYVLLLAMRSKDGGKKPSGGADGLTVISYDKISALTGIPRYMVSPAITLLLEMNLISFRSGSYRERDAQDFDRTNRYLIKGLNLRWGALEERVEALPAPGGSTAAL